MNNNQQPRGYKIYPPNYTYRVIYHANAQVRAGEASTQHESAVMYPGDPGKACFVHRNELPENEQNLNCVKNPRIHREPKPDW